MKQLLGLKLVCIGLISVMLSACSKDDKSPSVSKIIDYVEIWKGNEGTLTLNAMMNFNYSSVKKLDKIEYRQDDPVVKYDVYYRYESNAIEYNVYGNSDYKVRVELENGRAKRAYSEELGNFLYSYENGYLSSAILSSSNIILDYTWKNNNLLSFIYENGGTKVFSENFVASSIVNDYNIDLNILTDFMDNRIVYSDIKNTFGQIIGVLGKKSVNFLQSSDYTYEYHYDEDRRLSTIVIESSPVTSIDNNTYQFKIKYKE